jgi:ferredoxin
VRRVERAICGDAVAGEPAVAEGLALTGVRAASFADGARAASGEAMAVPGTSCVHHVYGVAGRERAGAFELAASSPQEAVDHCLAAHRLSRDLGRAGLCSLAPGLADRVALVELPSPALRETLLDLEVSDPETDAAPERIVELAERALRALGEGAARPAGVIRYTGDEPAEVVLVASGAHADEIADVAGALSAGGLPAAALAVNLVHPFPVFRVRAALASARHVFVVEPPGRCGGLLAGVLAAAAEKTSIVRLAPAAPAEMIEAMEAHWPADTFDEKWRAAMPAPAIPSHRLVLAPAGPWGDEAARRIATALGQLGSLQLGPSIRRELGAALLDWECEAIPEGGGDLLVVADVSLLDPRGTLSLIRPESTLLVVCAPGASEALAPALAPEVRSEIRERNLRLYWVADPHGADRDPGATADSDAASFHLAGAALAALCARAVPRADDAVDTAARQLEATGRAEAARALRAGADASGAIELEAFGSADATEEVDFRPAPTLPRMPAPPEEAAESAQWAPSIRHFHVTGGGRAASSGLPLWPVALRCLGENLRERSPHPFVLVRADDAAHPVAAHALCGLLNERIAQMQSAGRGARTLADNVQRLSVAAARELADREPCADLRDLLAAAARRLRDELELPEEEDRAFLADVAELRTRLPGDARVLDLRPETPLRVTLEVLDAVREPLHRRFVTELETLREQLRDLLDLDRLSSAEGRSPAALAASLGSSATERFDPDALAQMLPQEAASGVLDDARRGRVRAALAAIDAYLALREEHPRAVLVRSPSVDLALPNRIEQCVHPDPLAAAVGLFDGLSARMAEIFRAVRTARLEIADDYRHEVHDTQLASLDWEAFSAEEIDLVPAVIALTSGRRLRQRDQSSLSELLRSSRVVHVVVQDEVGSADEAENLSRFHVDLGALVIAHREAFAVASTLARPVRLVERLVRMARVRRPAVALYHLPALEPAELRSLLAEAALEGRAGSDFCYDPDAGTSWADRFDLAGSPGPERMWPVHSATYLEGSAERTLELALTFADAVALEPAFLPHFWVIPRAAWDDAQLPLAEWLEARDPETRKRSIPFLWVLDADNCVQRAVVTRELAMACSDRMRAWRFVQEVAGYENVFAERAAVAAREQALAEAAEVEQAHAGELERVRNVATREAMERLASALVSGDGLAAVVTSATAPTTAAPAPAVTSESAAPEPAAEVEEQKTLSFDEPYIVSSMCTSCNECIDLNSQLFRYNADKQACIGDVAAGTFAELVKAAELCPARCIHPGKPRSGDATATPAMIKRAAKFG